MESKWDSNFARNDVRSGVATMVSGRRFQSVIAWGKKQSFIGDVRPLIRAMGFEWLMRKEVLFGGCKSLCLDWGRKKKLWRRHRREMRRRDASDGSSIDCFRAVTLISLEYCEVIKRAARF